MDIKEARKKVNEKKKTNYMIVRILHDYGTALVLPHDQGVALLHALGCAERLTDSYNRDGKILPLDRETVITYSMSAQEYERVKIAQLLGVKPSELEEEPNKE